MTLDVITAARRRTRRLLAGVGLSIAVTAATAAGLVLSATPPTAAPDPTGVATSAAPAAGATAGPVLASGDLLPPDVSWVRLAGVDLPRSPQTGPAYTVGDLARGFAPTRAGAVVAALHLLVRTTPQVGPAIFEPTIDAQVTGEHATAMRHRVGEAYRRAAAAAGIGYEQPLGDLPARLVGIRIDGYTQARAQLSVLTAALDAAGVTRYAATPLTVVWPERDWRLLAPPGGGWDDLVRIVDPAQATGYTLLVGR